MIYLTLFFGLIALIGWGFGKKGIRISLIIIAVFVILMIIGLMNSSDNTSENVSNVPDSPTLTVDPNPSWHTVYQTSGDNGPTTTDDIKIIGQKLRIDYQTFNDGGFLDIYAFDVPYISVSGIASNSVYKYNNTPTTHTLDIDSIDQRYSIQVED